MAECARREWVKDGSQQTTHSQLHGARRLNVMPMPYADDPGTTLRVAHRAVSDHVAADVVVGTLSRVFDPLFSGVQHRHFGRRSMRRHLAAVAINLPLAQRSERACACRRAGADCMRHFTPGRWIVNSLCCL